MPTRELRKPLPDGTRNVWKPITRTTPALFLTALFGLQGKTSIVLGGTGTLGGAIADAYGRAGSYVYVVGRNQENGQRRVNLITENGGTAEFVPCDCTSEIDLNGLKNHIDQAGRSADVLVHCAGKNSDTPYLRISDDEFRMIMDTNFNSFRLATKLFIDFMLAKSTPGRIIAVTSATSGIPLSRVPIYSASKAAMESLVKFLAREYAKQGIHVNALQPGFFPAAQNAKLLEDVNRVDAIISHTPVGDFGKPEELQAAAIFLASEFATTFVTGTTVTVDGGFLNTTL
ncbi:gluconate 5-dehydrogenase [Candidatus Peregrinibacteria bacterium CG10_big_fil_rev_8_21_14_0_10_49_10]|nr:MAG: gluconate 5-dehydrogenase [Candidatus Peregrinibacteria bacterium CG10_big_fil_rev_8_21_14_0_10_49_10]